MGKKRTKVPAVPPIIRRPAPGTWVPLIEAGDEMMPWGRYRIRLHHPDVFSALVRGGDGGWGWLAYTVKGAQRKADRICRRENTRELRFAAREARLSAALMPGGPQ